MSAICSNISISFEFFVKKNYCIFCHEFIDQGVLFLFLNYNILKNLGKREKT